MLTLRHNIGNPAAQTLQLRPSDLDSGSVYSLDMAASFLRKCRDEHEGCPAGESLLPSRIIDTGPPDGLIRLIEPQGQSGLYACLSYCVRTIGLVGSFCLWLRLLMNIP